MPPWPGQPHRWWSGTAPCSRTTGPLTTSGRRAEAMTVPKIKKTDCTWAYLALGPQGPQGIQGIQGRQGRHREHRAPSGRPAPGQGGGEVRALGACVPVLRDGHRVGLERARDDADHPGLAQPGLGPGVPGRHHTRCVGLHRQVRLLQRRLLPARCVPAGLRGHQRGHDGDQDGVLRHHHPGGRATGSGLVQNFAAGPVVFTEASAYNAYLPGLDGPNTGNFNAWQTTTSNNPNNVLGIPYVPAGFDGSEVWTHACRLPAIWLRAT